MAQQRRGQVEDRRLQELIDLKVDPDQARAWLAAQAPEGEEGEEGAQPEAGPFVVWPENGPVLRVWLAMETQWRYRPNGQPQGLRYDQADVLLRRLRVPEPDTVFEQLIDMQNTALEAWYEQ